MLYGVQKGLFALRDDGQGHRLKSRAAEPSVTGAFGNLASVPAASSSMPSDGRSPVKIPKTLMGFLRWQFPDATSARIASA
jgi:hypothetical protein